MIAPIWFIALALGLDPQQTPTTAPATANAVHSVTAKAVSTAPRLDGVLDDPAWEAALPTEGFTQKEPQEGQAASQDTVVRVVFDEQNVYFGILCRDSEPDRIVSTERGRDRALDKDDNLTLILDTFHDHRNAFQFGTNALGARYDARITEEGRTIDLNWDDKWDVAAKVGSDGWAVEIAIPFKTLRSAGGENQTWGIDIQRMLRRRNELSYLQNYRRDFAFTDISKAGHLSGLTKVPEGLTWRIKPFGLAGFTDNHLTADPRRSNDSSAGADVKWRLAPGLTTDFTLNPDFAQAEVDEQIVNLTRFPAFFPEKREFFRESAGVFEFGTATGLNATSGRELIGFFSRRIGLSSTGEAVPIIAGGRLTGRAAGFEVGVLSMQTDDFRSELTTFHQPSTHYTVARVKRDVFSRSNIGAIVTNRQSNAGGDRNTVLGVDGNFVFLGNLRVRTFLTKSDTTALDLDGMRTTAAPVRRLDEWASRFNAQWNTDGTLAEAEYLDIGTDYNPEIGFVPRRDLKRYVAAYGIKRRPSGGILRQAVFRTRIEYATDQSGHVEDRVIHLPTFDFFFQAGDKLTVDYHEKYEFLPSPFTIYPGIVVPVGGYHGRDLLFIYESSPGRRVWGSPLARYRYTSGFYNGHANQYEFRPNVRVTSKLNVGLTYVLDDIVGLTVSRVDMRSSFVSHVVSARLDYSLSNTLLTTTMFQYNSRDNLQIFQFRVNRIFHLSDNVFLSFNQTKYLGTGRISRGVLVKTTYSLDF